jgi:hypothetical protein
VELGGALVAVAALVVLVVGTCRWVGDALHMYSHHTCTLTFAGDVVCPHLEWWHLQRAPGKVVLEYGPEQRRQQWKHQRSVVDRNLLLLLY